MQLVVSAASSWEIAIKHGLGRLPLPEPPERYVPERIRALAAEGLPDRAQPCAGRGRTTAVAS